MEMGNKFDCYLHRLCPKLSSNNLTLLFCRKFPKATDNGFIYIHKSPFIVSTKGTAESGPLRWILLCKYHSTADTPVPKRNTHVARLRIFHTKYNYSHTTAALSQPESRELCVCFPRSLVIAPPCKIFCKLTETVCGEFVQFKCTLLTANLYTRLLNCIVKPY